MLFAAAFACKRKMNFAKQDRVRTEQAQAGGVASSYADGKEGGYQTSAKKIGLIFEFVSFGLSYSPPFRKISKSKMAKMRYFCHIISKFFKIYDSKILNILKIASIGKPLSR